MLSTITTYNRSNDKSVPGMRAYFIGIQGVTHDLGAPDTLDLIFRGYSIDELVKKIEKFHMETNKA